MSTDRIWSKFKAIITNYMSYFEIDLILSTTSKSAGIKLFKARTDKDGISQLGPMIAGLFCLFNIIIIIFNMHFAGTFPRLLHVTHIYKRQQ